MMLIQKVRGMKDMLYKDVEIFNEINKLWSKIFLKYGYSQIITPVLEYTNLFNRSIGEYSDIVNKEMYSFFDLKNKSLSLRPEGTASCVRSIIENHLCDIKNNIKLWYIGPMFRYERPQKGRYRQFFQIGAEVFGSEELIIESELILMIKKFFTLLKLQDTQIILHINYIGNINTRMKYQKILQTYLNKYYVYFPKILQKTIDKNPLRIFDTKEATVKEILNKAPKITDYLEDKEIIRFNSLQNLLNELKINFVIDKTLVRGIDYYNGNVFEWKIKINNLDTTLCAGGRYDNLVQMIYPNISKKLPAVGFALGVERIMLALKTLNIDILNEKKIYKIYIIILDNYIKNDAFKLVEYIRNQLFSLANIEIFFDENIKPVKKQLNYANKCKIDLLILIGSNEIQNDYLTIKNFKNGHQYKIKKNDIYKNIKNIIYNI